jgi:hypothetical protein
MRTLLIVLVLLVVGVVAVGFYRGWFSFETTHDTAREREGARFEIDRSKIGSDIDRAKQKAGIGGTAKAGEKSEGQ